MSSIRIIPQYKLLLSYDIRPESYAVYQRYVLDEFIPGMQEMELYMLGAWHTAYGNYPIRQIEFVAEELTTVHRAFQDDRYHELEERLKSYIFHYERKIIRYRHGFQF